MQSISAVIFDLDGVLIDTKEKHIDAFIRAFQAANIPIVHCAFRTMYNTRLAGMKTSDAIVMYVAHINHKISQQQVDDITLAKRKIFGKICPMVSCIDPYAGLLMCDLHAAGLKIGIATGASRDRTEAFMTKFQSSHFIDAVQCGDDVQYGKPLPDIWLATATKLGVNPLSCIAVDDSDNNLMAARLIGMKIIPYRTSPVSCNSLLAIRNVIIALTNN